MLFAAIAENRGPISERRHVIAAANVEKHTLFASSGDVHHNIIAVDVDLFHIRAALTFEGALSWLRRREFLRKNKALLALLVMICLGSACLGSTLSGLPSFIVSLASSIASFVIGIWAVIKVIEIERGRP